MDIRFDGNVSTFVLDSSLYGENAIYEAAHEFNESCWISILPEGKSLSIRVEPKDAEIEIKEATYSFLNFALGLAHRDLRVSE